MPTGILGIFEKESCSDAKGCMLGCVECSN